MASRVKTIEIFSSERGYEARSYSLDGKLIDEVDAAMIPQLVGKVIKKKWNIDFDNLEYRTIECGEFSPQTGVYRNPVLGREMMDFHNLYVDTFERIQEVKLEDKKIGGEENG